MISGSRRASAVSTPRTIFSPITTPMLPPMNAYSMAATTVSMPSMRPTPTMIASASPVAWPAGREPIAVGLGVGERQRIVRAEIGVLLDPVLAVEQRQQPLTRGQAEVVAALGADAEVLDEIPACR